MNVVKKISINTAMDIVTTRMQVRETARAMGFGTADQARISLAASELARVLSRKYNEREIIIAHAQKNGHQGVQIGCLIDLEYIENGDNASPSNGSSASRTSFAGARQLVDECNIEMLDDKQARVTLMQWLK